MSSAHEVRRFYDAVASRYAELLPGPTAEEPLDLAVLDGFVKELARAPGAVLLDAGCGTGRLTPLIRDAGLRSIGVDPSAGMLAIARERFPDAEFALGDLAALPVRNRSVDGVLAWYSIIHTAPEGLDAVVAELARVLRPGGAVLLAFQAGSGVRRIERGYGTDAATTAVLHDPHDVAARLVAGGFAVDAVVHRSAVRERHDQGFVLARTTREPG
jgi:ubiquinone/menaquinone biosynthesis C-methylase UbiE